MAKETRQKDYPKLKGYKPTRFMLETSHYDKKKADRAVTFIENLCHTKGKWAGTRFWLFPSYAEAIVLLLSKQNFNFLFCLIYCHAIEYFCIFKFIDAFGVVSTGKTISIG